MSEFIKRLVYFASWHGLQHAKGPTPMRRTPATSATVAGGKTDAPPYQPRRPLLETSLGNGGPHLLLE